MTDITKTQYEKAQKIVSAYCKIRNEKEEQTHLKELEGLVGQCFKFRNSYGSDEGWWLYSKAIKIKDDNLIVEKIQKDCDGRIEIEKRSEYLTSLSSGHTKITEKEYRKGINPILKEFETINHMETTS